MTIVEMDAYILSIDDMEHRVIDDNLYPKVRNSRCKAFCYIISELSKECIRYFKISSNNNNATKSKTKSKE